MEPAEPGVGAEEDGVVSDVADLQFDPRLVGRGQVVAPDAGEHHHRGDHERQHGQRDRAGSPPSASRWRSPSGGVEHPLDDTTAPRGDAAVVVAQLAVRPVHVPEQEGEPLELGASPGSASDGCAGLQVPGVAGALAEPVRLLEHVGVVVRRAARRVDESLERVDRAGVAELGVRRRRARAGAAAR